MVANIKRLMRLYALYARMDLAWLLRDTRFALTAITTDVMAGISSISGVFLIAVRFGGVGGMHTDEVLFMLAYYTIISGLLCTFCTGGNIAHISRVIGRGQLEHMLVQPLSLPMQMATAGFIPFTGSSNLVAGLGLLMYAAHRLQLPMTLGWVGMLAGALCVTLAMMLSLSYLSACLAFYAPVAAEEISSDVLDAAEYLATFPLAGVSPALGIPLISALPSGLIAWFPSQWLLGKQPLGLPGSYPALIALLFFGLAYFGMRKGLRYYALHGTNRYSAAGHRR